MNHRYLFTIVAGIALAAFSTPAFAQFSGRTPGSGTLSAGQRSLFGGGGLGGTSGAPGIGSGTGGTTANAGQLNTSDRFVRGNRQPGQFVGADRQDFADFFSSLGTASDARSGSNNPLRPGGAGRTGGNRANQPGGPGGGSPRGPIEIRTSISVGFDFPHPAPPQLSTTLARRMEESPGIENRSTIQVAIEGRTAILRGEVATEHDRALAERLALLEAGIWAVKNELVVAAAAESPPPDFAPGPSLGPPAGPPR